MRRRLIPLAILVLAWCASTGAFGGCNLFRPAVPEQSQGGDPVPIDYTDPDKVLETMRLGLEAKAHVNGLDAYLGALSTPSAGGVAFTATFDPAVLSAHPNHPTGWAVEDERRFYSGFITLRQNPYSMVWSQNPSRNDFIEAQHVILYRRYQVYASSDIGDERIAVGFADIDMVNNGSRWFVTRWTDTVDPDIGPSPQNQEDQSFSSRRLNY